MVNKAKLQIPISEELNQQLKEKAREIGLSSTDIARLLLTNFANGKLSISFIEANKENSADEDLEYIIAKTIAEYKQGKTRKINCSKSIHKQLMEE